MNMITAEHLSKQFGDVRAVDDVSFGVREGEIFGFLGPNGAGKTTTINMLTGLARPDTGRITIAGIDCTGNGRATQSLFGIVPDESNLYPELTGFDNLSFCAALYGVRKADRGNRARELLKTFDLNDAAQRKFGGYSKGMKRKLTLAAGIIHRPQILFLDEPTTGIDVNSARQIRRLIGDLRQAGTTIFLTTHYIEEAERLCDRIAFIVAGRIVQIDTVESLLQPLHDKHIMMLTLASPSGGIGEKLKAAFPALAFEAPAPNLIRVEAGYPIQVGPLVRFFEDQGIDIAEARRMRPTLEDVFIKVTGLGTEAMRKEKGAGGIGGGGTGKGRGGSGGGSA
ncbi:MAG: ABC transporter ATP-binding protein [Deltaproteobacteria bacterium]|nr:ABC transporter ATP-binding protein [Deltaproteobacteria bacterium]